MYTLMNKLAVKDLISSFYYYLCALLKSYATCDMILLQAIDRLKESMERMDVEFQMTRNV